MASKPGTMLGGTAIRPVERHGMEKIRYFLHNPDTGEILSRTPKSWLLITIFYVIYYSCLAIFWAICFVAFLYTQTNDYAPKWQNTAGIIGGSPSLGLRPNQPKHLVRSSLIEIHTDPENLNDDSLHWQEWVQRVNNFFESYNRNDTSFDITTLEECSRNRSNYGYDIGEPCFYLKLNRIYGVENTPYNKSTLPTDMSEKLKTIILNQKMMDQTWVNCEEKSKNGNYLKMIDYFPKSHGIVNKLYSEANKNRDNLSPLIAIRLHPYPNATRIVDSTNTIPLIEIECRAWAENIEYNPILKLGSVSFQVKIRNTAVPQNT